MKVRLGQNQTSDFILQPCTPLPLRNATLIYNPIAGRHPARRERQIQKAAADLRNVGIAVRLAPTSGPGTAQKLAQATARQGENLILVCGGDGTINEVINGITPGQMTLGILPGGTANIIAKELGLPHDPVRAARELPNWSPRRIALGQATWPCAASAGAQNSEVERRYFLSVAGIGFDGYIVHKLSSDFKMSLGVVAYGFEAVRQALRYSFPPFVSQVDGREFLATFAVVQRASPYAGWLHLAPSADIFEDHFRLCLFKSRHRVRYFLYAVAVLARQHLRLRDVELLEAKKILCAAVESQTPIHFELDGELVGELPAIFEIVPNALTLLVP